MTQIQWRLMSVNFFPALLTHEAEIEFGGFLSNPPQTDSFLRRRLPRGWLNFNVRVVLVDKVRLALIVRNLVFRITLTW